MTSPTTFWIILPCKGLGAPLVRAQWPFLHGFGGRRPSAPADESRVETKTKNFGRHFKRGGIRMVDVERLFRLRLIVARFGEMDISRWWNTTNLLGQKGAAVVARGMPKTHAFGRARAAFAVARERCREIYNPQDAVTLWELPTEVESAFEERWSDWLDDPAPLADVFAAVSAMTLGADLLTTLAANGVGDSTAVEGAKKLRDCFRTVAHSASAA